MTTDPDHVVLHVEARDEIGEKEEWREHIDAIAIPLSAVRAAFGGDEGAILDDFGRAHPVSLARWASRDPSTRLVFHFSYGERDVPFRQRGSVYFHDVLARIA